jgi:hypothetical protein
MLKELFDLVKGNAADTVINNPDVPNEKNTEVVAEATNTIASGLRNIVAGGGVQSLLSLFNNSGGDKKSLLGNPIVSMMMGHFAGKLMTKYGLNNNQANNLSGNLIPTVLASLINKTNDPNEQGFSLEKLLGSITGNKDANQSEGGGIGDLLKQLSTGGQQAESGGGLMDIIKTLAGGAQQQQQKTGSGGLMDLLKGFM